MLATSRAAPRPLCFLVSSMPPQHPLDIGFPNRSSGSPHQDDRPQRPLTEAVALFVGMPCPGEQRPDCGLSGRSSIFSSSSPGVWAFQVLGETVRCLCLAACYDPYLSFRSIHILPLPRVRLRFRFLFLSDLSSSVGLALDFPPKMIVIGVIDLSS